MVWADSPPYFCAATDVADLANTQFNGDSPPHCIDADADTPRDPNGLTAVPDSRSPALTTPSTARR
jgi:hypothetical protein